MNRSEQLVISYEYFEDELKKLRAEGKLTEEQFKAVIQTADDCSFNAMINHW